MSTPATRAPAAFTSVTYTMPASASPLDTLVTTALTLSSRDTGSTLTPAAFRAWAAYAPHGTCSAHRTTLTPGRPRSAIDESLAGLPAGTAIWRRFWGE